MKFLFPSAVIRRRASDRVPRPEAIRSWRWVFLSAMLLAAATFGALSVGAVQAQASAVSLCNGYKSVNSYGFSVNENAGGNTLVGTLAACGNPHRDSLTYSVGGTDVAKFNEVFVLQTNKGEIAVKSGASIDYEAGPRSYSLTATVADSADSSEATIPLSITVLNVDDPGKIRLSTTDPWVGRQVSFSLSDPDGNPRIYRIEWSRADDRRSDFIRFLPVLTESDPPQFIGDLTPEIYTLRAADQWKIIKVTAYYVDDECLQITSFRIMCRKGAEAVFANIVADEEGLRIASQMENSPATGRVVLSAGRRNGAEIPPTINMGIDVSVYDLRDADGVPPRGTYLPKTYRWFRVDPGTLAEEEVLDYIRSDYNLNWTYRVTKADFGKSLKVQVSFYDNYDNLETLTSPLTAPVQRARARAATGSPVITGAVQVGQTLSVDASGIHDRNGIDYSALTYQWISNDGTEDEDIQDATGSTYILAAADEGKTIKVRVSFTDESLYEESRTSEPTTTVAPGQTSSQGSLLQNSSAPTITGSPALSDAGSDGEWTPGENVNVTLTFSEEVNVDTTNGTPSIGIQLGGTLDRSASYASGSGTTELVFSHTLTDDDGSHSSIFVPEDSLTLNGGTITSASSGSDAALGHLAAARASIAVPAIPNSPATGAPTISGTAQVGQMLTASTSDISDDDGLADAIFTYQWTANDGTEDRDIQNATGSTYTVGADDEGKTIKVRVSFTDDRGNQETRTSDATAAVAAAPSPFPLTATIHDAPKSHDGKKDFSFELRFSEDPKEDFSYKTLKDHAFTVTGGEVDGARRLEEGKNIRWQITVSPDSNADVTVVLPATADCEADGAVCTDDGRMLSEGLELIVKGPPLTVSSESVPSSHNGSDDFTFRITFSEELETDFSFTTLKDHAFTVTGGDVDGARRLVRGSNVGWEIRVEPGSSGDVTVVLPATTDCEADSAICTEDGRMLSGELKLTVSGPGQ